MLNLRRLFTAALIFAAGLSLTPTIEAQNRTRFGGMYNSADYAYGLVGNSAPNALQVAVGTTATGAGTLTLVSAKVTLGDGTTLFPLATTTPITVGSGSTQETVTPSAVSNCAGDFGYQTCQVTATFANVHGVGENITSGTAGLQEAINAANSGGGGVAVVDSRWTTAGGTAAMLTAATLPSNGTVAMLDNRGSYGTIQTMTVLVPNAAVKTLFSVGTTLLPAPGAGNAYSIQEMVVENVFATAAFAAGGAIQASYGTGVTTPATATIAATFLTSPVANQSIKVAGALASSLSSAITNKAITLAAATADFTTGGGSLIVKISYRLITGL